MKLYTDDIPKCYPNFYPKFQTSSCLAPADDLLQPVVSVLRFGECFPPNHGGRNDGTTLDNGGLLKTQTSRYHQQLYTKYTKYTNDYAGIMRAKESRVEQNGSKKRSLTIYISNNHQLCRPHQINTSHHRTCQFTSMCRFSPSTTEGFPACQVWLIPESKVLEPVTLLLWLLHGSHVVSRCILVGACIDPTSLCHQLQRICFPHVTMVDREINPADLYKVCVSGHFPSS